MYDNVKRLYLTGRIDISGLERAIQLKWITEEQKLEIIELKRLQDQQ